MNPVVAALKYGLLLMGLAGIGLYFLKGGVGFTPQPLPPELVGHMAGMAKPLEPFQLQDHDGRPFTLDTLTGRWHLLFFGYAHCPDVCPMAMEEMKELVGMLEKKSPATFQALQGVFVSVDPERDPPATLKPYVTFFHPRFLGVTGTSEQLASFARQVGAGYKRLSGTSPDNYLIAHTSNFYLIDPKGVFIAYYGDPRDPEALASKLIAIRQAYGENP